jgi:hypothetical protein
MGLRGYNNPRPSPDVLSGQDCSLRKRATARECFPTSRCGLSACSETARPAGGRDSCGQQAIFALENWPNGSVSAIGMFHQACGVTIFAVCNFVI